MKSTSGKIKISLFLLGAVLFVIGGALYDNGNLSFRNWAVQADTATTTLQVLNIVPNWTVDAQESVSITTSSPVNVGNGVTWLGTATDPNGDSYYLLICKSSSSPTAGSGGAAPTCAGGGGNLWSVSPATPSTVQASTTYVTQAADPQINAWWAWICDNNAVQAGCNATSKQGTGSTASPFYLNHRPTFTVFTNTSPTLPGATTTWNATATDTDTFAGTSSVRLFVCKANDFTGTACGAGGTLCTSATTTSNPSCGFFIPVPTQDTVYNAFGYVVDQFSFAASGGQQGANSTYTVSAATPTISSSTITLNNNSTSSVNLTLTTPSGQTSGYKVKFTVADNNSCLNASGGSEITSTISNVYRQGVGQSNCTTAGQYNPDNCYPFAASSSWAATCVQDGGSCVGSSSLTATFTCTFPLWYVSDPTDGTLASDTQFFADIWNTSVQATTWVGVTSSLVEANAGTELSSFLAYHLNTASINYGALQPGSTTDPLVATTSLSATGNVGLDETLYGLDMCTTFPVCATGSPTSTIPIAQQKYATSSVAYASGVTTLTNPGALFPISINKSTSTGTTAFKLTFWGVSVPGTIQQAGNYTGQNTFIGVKSPAQRW